MQGLITGFATGDPSAIQTRRPSPLYPQMLGFSPSGVNGDYVTIPASASRDQTTAFSVAFVARVLAGSGRNTQPLVACWNWTAVASRFAITLHFNYDTGSQGVSCYLGDGTSNSIRGSHAAAGLPADTDTEVCVSYDGAQATDATRLRIFTRPRGGTWTQQTLTQPQPVPVSVPAIAQPMTVGRWTGFPAPEFFNGYVGNLRWFSSSLTPSGTTDIPLTTCTAQWRFRERSSTTSAADVGGVSATLATTYGSSGPARSIDGWIAAATPSGSVIAAFGDSKVVGTGYTRGSFLEELVQQCAARGKRCQTEGLYTYPSPLSGFAPYANHTGFGGAIIPNIDANLVAPYVAGFAPKVIILEGGTNDLLAGATAATVLTRMTAMITTARTQVPTATVVVLEDPIVTDAAITAAQATYNAGLPAVVAGFTTGQPVYLASGYGLRTDHLSDTYHPNEHGYRRIACAMADAVASAL